MEYYTWKTIPSAPACRAVRAGAEICPLPITFSSGGYSYTHSLTTKRGTRYAVSKQVMRDVEYIQAEMRSEAEAASLGTPLSENH